MQLVQYYAGVALPEDFAAFIAALASARNVSSPIVQATTLPMISFMQARQGCSTYGCSTPIMMPHCLPTSRGGHIPSFIRAHHQYISFF